MHWQAITLSKRERRKEEGKNNREKKKKKKKKVWRIERKGRESKWNECRMWCYNVEKASHGGAGAGLWHSHLLPLCSAQSQLCGSHLWPTLGHLLGPWRSWASSSRFLNLTYVWLPVSLSYPSTLNPLFVCGWVFSGCLGLVVAREKDWDALYVLQLCSNCASCWACCMFWASGVVECLFFELQS